jgi:hypothetical protein
MGHTLAIAAALFKHLFERACRRFGPENPIEQLFGRTLASFEHVL